MQLSGESVYSLNPHSYAVTHPILWVYTTMWLCSCRVTQPTLWVNVAMYWLGPLCGSMQLCGYTVTQPTLWVHVAMSWLNLLWWSMWLCSYVVTQLPVWVYEVVQWLSLLCEFMKVTQLWGYAAIWSLADSDWLMITTTANQISGIYNLLYIKF